MSDFLSILLQCGAFVFFPVGTLGLGLWLIHRLIGFQNRLASVLIVMLIGIVFFEGTLIGTLLDPKAAASNIVDKLKISGLVGAGALILVLIFLPIYQALYRLLSK